MHVVVWQSEAENPCAPSSALCTPSLSWSLHFTNTLVYNQRSTRHTPCRGLSLWHLIGQGSPHQSQLQSSTKYYLR